MNAIDSTLPENPTLPPDLHPRLVRLCDGRNGLRGSIPTQVKEPAETAGRPVIDFIASDETLDRYDEVLSVSGWRLEAYQRNPVFQNAHQYGDVIFTLGKALETVVREGRLRQRVEFATEVNPMARVAYGLYRGGFLNAVSVGFIPLRWEDLDGREGGCRRRYLEQELLEVSAVSLPANPNALQLGLQAGAIGKDDLWDLLDLLRQATRVPFDLQQPRPRRGSTKELLSLARQVQELIRRH